jgi:hypothetical protein
MAFAWSFAVAAATGPAPLFGDGCPFVNVVLVGSGCVFGGMASKVEGIFVDFPGVDLPGVDGYESSF